MGEISHKEPNEIYLTVVIINKGENNMNIAVIIAGGSGHRMGQDIPKQFINVYDKPILMYMINPY